MNNKHKRVTWKEPVEMAVKNDEQKESCSGTRRHTMYITSQPVVPSQGKKELDTSCLSNSSVLLGPNLAWPEFRAALQGSLASS